MENENTWAVESEDGTEVCSGMSVKNATSRAIELTHRTGRRFYAVNYADHSANSEDA